MRTEHLSSRSFLAGILIVAIGSVGCSDGSGDATDEATGGAEASGGAAAVGTGGSVMTGGSGQSDAGGTPGFGGSAVQPVTGGAPGDGGTTASGGSTDTGGAQGVGGTEFGMGGSGMGGSGMGGSGIGGSGIGGSGIGGSGIGGSGIGGSGTGGNAGMDGGSAGEGTGGDDAAGGTTGDGGSSTGGSTATCTASQAVSTNASGSGPHDVVVETSSDPGINEGTIFRPADLGGDEQYPILAWGEGACSQDGLSNATAMAEIASHGYFVIADGTPDGGSANRPMGGDVVAMGEPLLAYITWSIAENDKPCSAYYQSLDTTKIAADGFSCGGLMAEGTAGDPRMTTWGITSSGLTGASAAFYETVHTPVLIILGGPSDIAYENGERDYDNISVLGVPIMLFSKDIGHGGDLWSARGGDFTRIHLAWLNWWLKGDEGATGRGVLEGSGCTYCTDSAWEVKSANLP